MAGLMVCVLVCGVTLIALLDMTEGATRGASIQARASRESRALDAALDAAVHQVRSDPDRLIGAPGGADTCARQVGAADGDGLRFADETGVEVVVVARCETPQPGVGAGASTGNGNATAARLDVVGDGYRSPAGLADTLRWTLDCSDPTAGSGNCMPWRTALGAPAYAVNAGQIASQPLALLHTAHADVAAEDATMRVNGDVVVRRGGLALVHAQGTAGLRVAGSYLQGAPATLGTHDLVGCGATASTGTGSIADASEGGNPDCDVPVDARVEGLPAPTSWAAVSPRRSTPACPAPGATLRLEPGAYDRIQTAALNDLLGGQCPGRVLWFDAGDYWFDVHDSSQASPEQHSLVIDDPTLRVVFGTPVDAAVTGCDPDQDGVSITLTPRTSLRHRRGHVSICDRVVVGEGDTIPPALWQTARTDGGWVATPSPSESSVTFRRKNSATGVGSSLTNGSEAWIIDGQSATAKAGCGAQLNGQCGAVIEIRGRGFGSGAPALPGSVASQPVRSLGLIVRTGPTNDSSASANGGDGSATSVVLRTANGDAVCGVELPIVAEPRPDMLRTHAYDLLSPVAGTAGDLPRCIEAAQQGDLTRGDLIDAGVDVSLRVGEVIFDGMELRSGWNLGPAGATAASGWSDVARLLALDGSSAHYSSGGDCGNGNGNGNGKGNGKGKGHDNGNQCPDVVRSFRLTNFDNLDDPHVPTDGSLVRAGLVVTGEPPRNSGGGNRSDEWDGSWTRATVELADGSTCSVQWSGADFAGQARYLDLLESSGTCDTLLTGSALLIGADVKLEMSVTGRRDGDDHNTRIDHVRLSTVSDGDYLGPVAPNLVSLDGPDSRLTVAGAWSTPRNTLNVSWLGLPPSGADAATQPVLGASSVVEAAGSYVGPQGRAGVLCCAADRSGERLVTLTATIQGANGARTATARIRVDDTVEGVPPVTVEEWTV